MDFGELTRPCSSFRDKHARDPPRFPTELLLAIFIHLDGPTLASCAAVCRQWSAVVRDYDDVIWKACAQRDFQPGNPRRFWLLHFPQPDIHNRIGSERRKKRSLRRSWQDMYRITRNWFTGGCIGYFPTVIAATAVDDDRFPHAIVGTPQEHTFFTTLTATSTGHIVRSNPTYRRPGGPQALILEDPWTRTIEYLDGALEPGRMHTIFCHYSHPSSQWVVTGSLDGSVALWNVPDRKRVRLWNGHRGRVLCVAMNAEVVVSGGSDSMLRVWDLNEKVKEEQDDGNATKRGMIDISAYLTARSDWYQGIGEVAVNEHLVACSPDASGPILIFSLLTGSLVYELRCPAFPTPLNWLTSEEEMMTGGFTKLCLTPYFLLSKGKLPANDNAVPVLPSLQSNQRSADAEKPERRHQYGYVARLDESRSPPPPAARMTPYQLYQYYQSLNDTSLPDAVSETSISQTETTTSETNASSSNQLRGCINVWDLQTGKVVYRLAPQLDRAEHNYVITDIRVTPDSSKVFACIEVRSRGLREERLYCWDFAGTQTKSSSHRAEASHLVAVQLDGRDSEHGTSFRQYVGNSWACFM